jgi:hypothetical protein
VIVFEGVLGARIDVGAVAIVAGLERGLGGMPLSMFSSISA